LAQQEYDQYVALVRQEVNTIKFTGKKLILDKLREEYQLLIDLERNKLVQLPQIAEKQQKNKFLEGFFIDTAKIPKIGPAKKATLASFNIETAADVSWDAVFAVKGFGNVYTQAMVNWRQECERKFVFNPAMTTEADEDVVRQQMATRKRPVEIALKAGVAELQRMREEMIDKANYFIPQLQAVSQNLAQKQANISVFD
jgi:DNA-binding helix-hairpin-helix protein with protein kinase domain